MASIPSLSSALPSFSSHPSPSSHSNPNHLPCAFVTLPLTSFFGETISLRRSTTSTPFLTSKNCRPRPTSATVSFSLPTKKHQKGTPEKSPQWSARAIKSFQMAEVEAKKLKYPNTGTESLLMGILIEGTSNAAKFLRANGITFFKVREETVELLGKSDMYIITPEHPPLTEQAQRAIDWAIDEKLKSGEGGEITVNHLLLAIWAQEDSAGRRVLAALGFNDEKAKELAQTINEDVDLSFKKQT